MKLLWHSRQNTSSLLIGALFDNNQIKQDWFETFQHTFRTHVLFMKGFHLMNKIINIFIYSPVHCQEGFSCLVLRKTLPYHDVNATLKAEYDYFIDSVIDESQCCTVKSNSFVLRVFTINLELWNSDNRLRWVRKKVGVRFSNITE